MSSLRSRLYVALLLEEGACVASLPPRSEARALLPGEMMTNRRKAIAILVPELSPLQRMPAVGRWESLFTGKPFLYPATKIK
jgi:hypothetical protein